MNVCWGKKPIPQCTSHTGAPNLGQRTEQLCEDVKVFVGKFLHITMFFYIFFNFFKKILIFIYENQYYLEEKELYQKLYI